MSFLTWEEKKTQKKKKKKRSRRNTHLLLMQVKTRDTNWNDIKKFSTYGEKKEETFHTEIITAGWTNIKPLKENGSYVCVRRKTCVTFNKCVSLGEHAFYQFVFNTISKTILWNIRIHQGRSVWVQKLNRKTKLESQTCWKWHKPQCHDKNRSQSWNDTGCTLYKTRTNSHPDRCEYRKANKNNKMKGWNIWVHLQCGRWCWQSYILFTCSAMMMMMKKEDGVLDSTACRGERW